MSHARLCKAALMQTKAPPSKKKLTMEPNSPQEMRSAPWTLGLTHGFGEMSPLPFSAYEFPPNSRGP